MADGRVIIDVDVEIKQAEKQLEEVKRIAEDSGEEVSRAFDVDIDNLEKQMQKAKNKIEETNAKLEETRNKLNDLKQIDRLNFDKLEAQQMLNQIDEEFKRGEITIDVAIADKQLIQQGISEIDSQINALNMKTKGMTFEGLTSTFDSQQRALDNANLSMGILGNRATNLGNKITQANSKANELNSTTKKVDSSMKKTATSASNVTSGISKGISRLGKYALALFSIRSIYQSLSRLSRQWLNSDDEGARQVKANIEAMSSALSNALAPAITYLANLLATVFGYVNAILKTFFGIDLLAKKTNKNVGGVASGTKKARKEAERFTSAFDKADIATEKIADNLGSAGGGGSMDLPAAKIPTPDISGLLKSFETIKNKFLEIWNSADMQSVMNSLKTIAGNTFDSIVSIGTNAWGNIERIFLAMLPNLSQGFVNIKDLWVMQLEDIANFTDEWLPRITGSFNSLVDSIYKTFEPLMVFFSQLWSDITGIMLEIWEEYGTPILDKFGKFVDETIKTFNRLWSEWIDPIISPIIKLFRDLWDEHLKDIIKEFGFFVGDLIDGALEIWNEVISPIINWLIDKLAPAFRFVGDIIENVIYPIFSKVFGTIKGIIKDLRIVLGGIIDFIVGVFTGDWQRAWNGVSKIFEVIFKGIANFFKAPLNFIIDGINTFIRSLNRIKIPSWVPAVGGKGFNIPTMQRLATGGFASSGAMNVIFGENGREVALPLDNNSDRWANPLSDALMAKMGNSGGTETVNLVVSGHTLATINLEEEKKRKILMNGAYSWT